MNGAILEKIYHARVQLRDRGERDTQDAVLAIVGGSKSTMVRYWQKSNPATYTPTVAQASTPANLPPAIAPPVVPTDAAEPAAAVPATFQALTDAQAALDGARAQLRAVERDTQMARNQGLLLTTALRAGTLSRHSEAWEPFDAAQQQLARATEAVEDAAEDLKRAERRHQGGLRAAAEAAYAQTAAGKAALAEIDRLKRLYDDAAKAEAGSVASYSDALARERSRFNEAVSAVLARSQPPALPAAPSGPPPRLSVETLRGCYVHDGIGRVMPPGIACFEYEDYAALVQFSEMLRQETTEANRVYRDLEADDHLGALVWHDPRTLPLRQARQRYNELYTAVQEITTDIRNLQQRAASEGRTL